MDQRKKPKKDGRGHPTAEETRTRPVRLAATMLLSRRIKEASGLSSSAIEEKLGLTEVDLAKGRTHSGGATFRRYLIGTRAIDDPQQVAELAIKKGLLPKAARGGLLRGLDNLLSSPINEPLVETITQIQNERAMLIAARQTAVDALTNLRSAIAASKTVALGRSLGEGDDRVFDEVRDLDLERTISGLEETFLAVYAPAELVAMLPQVPPTVAVQAGTKLAQSRHNRSVKRR